MIVEQVVGHGETNPRGTLGWTKLEKLLAGFLHINITYIDVSRDTLNFSKNSIQVNENVNKSVPGDI